MLARERHAKSDVRGLIHPCCGFSNLFRAVEDEGLDFVADGTHKLPYISWRIGQYAVDNPVPGIIYLPAFSMIHSTMFSICCLTQ